MTSYDLDRSVTPAAPDGAAPDTLLRLFRDGRPRTRADVIEETGHARSTVGPRLAQLAGSGFLRTERATSSTGGRRPVTFVFNPDARAILAIELGPSHCRVVAGNLGPSILAERYERLDATRDPDEVFAEVELIARDVLRSSPLPPLVGIGVSLPTPLDARSRRPLRPPLMPSWDGYDVQGRLKAIARIPVAVDRDNSLRALGEYTLDPEGNRDMIYIHASTWVSAGVIIEGHLVRGVTDSAGHFGHVTGPWGEDEPCVCGNSGCLEAVASGRALVRRFGASLGVSSTRDVVTKALEGDTTAMNAIREVGRTIGLAVASLVSVLNPSKVVLGGSLSQAGVDLLNGVRETVYSRSFPLVTQSLRVVTATSGPHAAILGASAIAVEHYLAAGMAEHVSYDTFEAESRLVETAVVARG